MFVSAHSEFRLRHPPSGWMNGILEPLIGETVQSFESHGVVILRVRNKRDIAQEGARAVQLLDATKERLQDTENWRDIETPVEDGGDLST
jgi:hypothetical protein